MLIVLTKKIFIYLCKNKDDMAVYVKAIPTLNGEVAERFILKSEENLQKRASIDFSKEAANSRAILAKRSCKR